jgi:hypothetical protein
MPLSRSRLFHFLLQLTACIALAAPVLSGGQAAAQTPPEQIALTEKQVQGYIAAQKPMSEVTEKMQGSASDKPDPKIQAALEAIAKKHGFKDFAEYDQVATAISTVMAGIDPDTKEYTALDVAIRQQIAEVEADKSIPTAEKKQMIDEFKEALKHVVPLRHPGNIALVKKYYDKIDEVLQ